MRIAVTGAGGMLGWHVRCRALASGVESVRVPRELLADPPRLAVLLRDADAVVHCAGVNRGPEHEVVEGNLAAARGLAEAVRVAERPIRLVFANSIHAHGDGAHGGYAAAKRKSAELLAGAAPAGFSDVVLPHLFGEHARPYHNSVVATFCREVADGRRPVDVRDREVSLLHAQDAAAVMVGEAGAAGERVVEPDGEPTTVAGVLRMLEQFAASYGTGDLPDLSSRFRVRLFHTYRSHLFPDRFPIPLPRRSDPRGELVECVRTATSGGQAFVSSTVPGAVRGEHFHLRKFERYVVVDGQAEIALRRLFTDQVVRFLVRGEQPAIVDMPTLWTHKITNVDSRPVTTFFWSNELYHAEDADTFACPVDHAADSEGASGRAYEDAP